MTRYTLMVFAGACSFGILSTFVKLSYGEGYTAAEISLSQAFCGMLCLWALWGATSRTGSRTSVKLPWRERWGLLLTGVTIGLTTFVYYVSVKYIPASVAIVILMQFTWMGVLLDWIFFGKKPGVAEGVIILLILVGAVLSGGWMKAGEWRISVTGILFALLAALLYAIYIVANSRVGKEVSPLQKSVVIMTGSTLGILLVNVPVLTAAHLDAGLLKWALFLALFGTIIPPVLFAKGIPRIGATMSAIVMTAELPVAILCSHFVLHEQLSTWQCMGILIMLLSIAGLQLRNKI
ncbi:EamA family transporter [Chitinophaga solisilvae]|uniref:EamA family transporter n=1 Tax=Chitinophaga solisilvae TaxID=1233460 RepID=UPI001367ECB5|nr:DMT family transporter [Chitinophaga solisilvae]